jgi:hypothetical protein
LKAPLLFLILLAGLVLALVLFVPGRGGASYLDNLDGCPITGSARGTDKASDNRLKNRYESPHTEDFEPAISLDALLAAGSPQDFDNRRAVRLVGYVRNVKVGGVESCNCRAIDPAHRDTHVELVSDAGEDERKVVIAEITPRIRRIAAQQGMDWSTDALKSKYLGQRVSIEGWLYFDPDHIEESFANDPADSRGKTNWRGTCWEIHPVTSIVQAPR